MTQSTLFVWTDRTKWCTTVHMRVRRLLNASIRVPVTPELKTRLEEIAEERGELPAAMARRVLKEFAERRTKREKERVA